VHIIAENNIDWLCDKGCALARRRVSRRFLSRLRTRGTIDRSRLALSCPRVVALFMSLYHDPTDKARRNIPHLRYIERLGASGRHPIPYK